MNIKPGPKIPGQVTRVRRDLFIEEVPTDGPDGAGPVELFKVLADGKPICAFRHTKVPTVIAVEPATGRRSKPSEPSKAPEKEA
jgi:hypothetical protein